MSPEAHALVHRHVTYFSVITLSYVVIYHLRNMQ